MHGPASPVKHSSNSVSSLLSSLSTTVRKWCVMPRLFISTRSLSFSLVAHCNALTQHFLPQIASYGSCTRLRRRGSLHSNSNRAAQGYSAGNGKGKTVLVRSGFIVSAPSQRYFHTSTPCLDCPRIIYKLTDGTATRLAELLQTSILLPPLVCCHPLSSCSSSDATHTALSSALSSTHLPLLSPTVREGPAFPIVCCKLCATTHTGTPWYVLQYEHLDTHILVPIAVRPHLGILHSFRPPVGQLQ